MKRRHRMPFGADLVEDGTVCFSLWAPAAGSVDVRLATATGEHILPMARRDDGFFSLSTPAGRAGDRYTYLVDRRDDVPDPASRRQPLGVHGPSEIVDPVAFAWSDGAWRGRPWEEAVLYELHVGTFTPAGTYAAAATKLDHLAELGVTAIELMPLAEAPGTRNWGYDGVYLFAPESRYGSPEDLKQFVCEAHRLNLMVFVDVVYNHFGPEGNYLWRYAPQFFTDRHRTPWGAAIDYDGPGSRPVRDFYIHNALYWLTEYHLDGLRLDAVHAIRDESEPHILVEIAEVVSRAVDRPNVHLVLENDDNAASFLDRSTGNSRCAYVAQWNDDFHHALHVLMTGEMDGYYADYADDPTRHLARSVTQGFAYQGEPSRHRGGRRRGEPSAHLPVTSFISFLQNHDQIGNRVHGERISVLATPEALRAAVAFVLLTPFPPLLFMGEEWGCRRPFHFFCDFEPELARKVRDGRRSEFANFPHGARASEIDSAPDPLSLQTFEASTIDWKDLTIPEHAEWLAIHRRLLALRERVVIPRLRGATAVGSSVGGPRGRLLTAVWLMADGCEYRVVANVDAQPVIASGVRFHGEIVFATDERVATDPGLASLPPWFVAWTLSASQGA